MQNEESVFHRAFEPDLITCSAWKCQSKHLWLLTVWQSGAAAVVVPWCHSAVGCRARRVCSGGWCGSEHLSLTISVPSSLGRHHKMCGEYWPQPSLSLARGSCLQLWSLPQGYLLRPAAREMNPSRQVQPPHPISSPAPEAVVMAIWRGGREEPGQTKGLFSPFGWEQMINHSLFFVATGASLAINPFKSLVSLGDLGVWPGHCQSPGTLIAAVCSVDCQTSGPYSCVACLC